jgi:hypothetical protein
VVLQVALLVLETEAVAQEEAEEVAVERAAKIELGKSMWGNMYVGMGQRWRTYIRHRTPAMYHTHFVDANISRLIMPCCNSET